MWRFFRFRKTCDLIQSLDSGRGLWQWDASWPHFGVSHNEISETGSLGFGVVGHFKQDR